MSKIGFKRLSRGVKLLTGHIHAQVQSALDRITSTGFRHDEMERGAGTFRVNISLPNITPAEFANFPPGGSAVMRCCAGFTLPPYQELFSATAQVTQVTPVYVLESVSLSIDQQATPFATERATGALLLVEADKVAMTLTIQRKKIDVFSGEPITVGGVAAATASPDMRNVTLSLDYPNITWNNENVRANPGVSSDLDMTFDPYSAYLLSVECGDLVGATKELRIDSLLVSMKFRTQLAERDTTATVQNMPQSPDLPAGAQYGARLTSPETVVTPAAGAVIVADADATDDGVSGALIKPDVKFLRGLLGGYTQKSRRWGPSNILHDAGYEVISVPMWGNGWYCKGEQPAPDPRAVPLTSLPYSGGAPYLAPTGDRRIIPIHFPFVLHHVIAFVNYSGGPLVDRAIDYSTTNEWTSVASSTLKHTIGVGISTGVRGDISSSRNVAFASWDRSTIDAHRISRMSYVMQNISPLTLCQGDLMRIPLVYDAATPGVGYDASVNAALSGTGGPIFIGQTDSPDIARSGMADAPAGVITPLDQDGYEQFIEVRWNIEEPAAGLDQMNNSEVIIGQGGFQVYLIGKKHLC